jgi:hypothetical protein
MQDSPFLEVWVGPPSSDEVDSNEFGMGTIAKLVRKLKVHRRMALEVIRQAAPTPRCPRGAPGLAQPEQI